MDVVYDGSMIGMPIALSRRAEHLTRDSVGVTATALHAAVSSVFTHRHRA